MTVAMGMTITNLWKLFCYGVQRDHYEKLIIIREFLEQLTMYCFNNPFSTDTGNPEKKTYPLDEVDERETVSTYCALHFSSYVSMSTELITIYNITLNSDSLLAYNLMTSTIGSQHISEKEEARE